MNLGPSLDHVYQNHHLDSTRWDVVKPRDDDIVITTSYKSGTTWTQWIVYNLIFLGETDPPPFDGISPWVDARFMPFPLEQLGKMIEEQTHRRFLKSHLPGDGLPFHANVKYVVVARDARDVFMSLVNHYAAYTDVVYAGMNDTPGRVGDPMPRFDGDIRRLWQSWISRGWFEWESEGYPMFSNMHHTRTWWPHRELDNVLLVHYNDLKRDLPGEIQRLGAFLDIAVSDTQANAVATASHIDAMRERAIENGDGMKGGFKGGAKTFFYKGTNERWRGVLTDDDLELYEQAKQRVLDEDCAEWLENGWLGLSATK